MKKSFRVFSIVLTILIVAAISSCDEQMTPQMDPIIDAVMEDPQPPPRITPPIDEQVTPPPEPAVTLPAGTVVFVEPRQTTSPAAGQQLKISINVKGAADVLAYEMTVGFDPTALRYVSITNADYLPAGAFASPPQTTVNSVYMAATSVTGAAAAPSGTLATVTFEVVSAKASTITLSDALLSDSNVTALALTSVDGKVIAP